MSSMPYIGQLMLFAGNFAPVGWAFCQGQLMPINSYSALFSLLGTTYGGDGRTTFGLPDLRGRAPVHFGTRQGGRNYALGQAGGSESVTLTTSQLPSHRHAINAVAGAGNTASPAGSFLASQGGEIDAYSTATADTSLSPDAVGYTGSSQPVETQSPYLAMNWCIALDGIYPSRS